MAALQFDLPTAGAPTASLQFRESLVSITRKRPTPIQQIEVAVSGKEFVRTLSANIEEIWEIDFSLLHEADDGTANGFTALKGFITSTSTGASHSENTFEVTDADGDTLVGRYIRGIENFEEGGIRQRGKATRFNGSIVFRKTIS